MKVRLVILRIGFVTVQDFSICRRRVLVVGDISTESAYRDKYSRGFRVERCLLIEKKAMMLTQRGGFAGRVDWLCRYSGVVVFPCTKI